MTHLIALCAPANRLYAVFLGCLIGVLCPLFLPDSAQAEESVPEQVFQTVLQIKADAGQFAVFLGDTTRRAPRMPIRYVSPPELYQAAVALERKLEALRAEQRVVDATDTFPPPEEMGWSETLVVLQRAESHMKAVLNEHSLAGEEASREGRRPATATRVFWYLVSADRVVENLMKEKTTSADVYQVVGRAVQLAHIVRGKLLEGEPPGVPVPVEGLKSTAPFDGLLRCHRLLRKILFLSGSRSAVIKDGWKGTPETEPSDVMEIANLLYGQLDVLFRQISKRPLPTGVYFPGPALPQDVYTRVHQLELILGEILLGVREKKSETKGPLSQWWMN